MSSNLLQKYCKLNVNKNFIELEDYYLLKGTNIYKIEIEKRKTDVRIMCKNYKIKLTVIDVSLIADSILKTIDEAYDFIINLFEQNKVSIIEILKNKEIILSFKINDFNEEKDEQIKLIYSKDNTNSIINELRNNYCDLKNDINDLKNEVSTFKKDLDQLKINNELSLKDNLNFYSNKSIIKVNQDNNSNPKNIQFLNDLKIDSYSSYSLDNKFCVFKSINDILYLAYTNENKSIISYDLLKNIKINEVKKAHNNFITNLRYYLDTIKKRDLILSLSKDDNNLKLWDFNRYECILDIKNVNKKGELLSACLLINDNQINVISSNDFWAGGSEPLKVFDLDKKIVKEITNSNKQTYYIDSYYDEQFKTDYIITGNRGCVISYDFNKNQIYHKYCDNDSRAHCSIAINSNDDTIKLVESCDDGNLRIWNFHTGILLNKIKVNNEYLFGVCIWDDDYIFVGCKDKLIKLIDLNKGMVVKNLKGHNNDVVTVKKVKHPKYGECLISQGSSNDNIKLWINKK